MGDSLYVADSTYTAFGLGLVNVVQVVSAGEANHVTGVCFKGVHTPGLFHADSIVVDVRKLAFRAEIISSYFIRELAFGADCCA